MAQRRGKVEIRLKIDMELCPLEFLDIIHDSTSQQSLFPLSLESLSSEDGGFFSLH
jgi:hypothetical protein